MAQSAAPGRLIVVINWLQSHIKNGSREPEKRATRGYGCLFSAVRALKERGDFSEVVWIGGAEEQCDEDLNLASEYGHSLAIKLSPELIQRYYIGFCKTTLWPLLHYETSRLSFRRKDWEAYQQVNARFADAIESIYRENDTIWIQDYHFMLLPAMLRQRIPSTSQIAYYLHTPFPSSELYRVLAVREDLLNGILGANVIGFQIWDYSRHFVSSCTRILHCDDMETTHRSITRTDSSGNRMTSSMVIYPTGIDPKLYQETLAQPEVVAQVAALREKFSGKKVILGCDALESSCGLVQKFEAFENFLSTHSSTPWRGGVVLIQICPKPQHMKGREAIEDHKRLCHQINELVGRINGRFGTPDYCPLIYLTTPPSFEEYCAFNRIADVYLLTSLRDGLNLGPSEFVACQRGLEDEESGPGVTIISEFAGANQSISGSIRVNPWDYQQVSLALERALTMELSERVEKQDSSLAYVEQSTAAIWASAVMAECTQQRSSVNPNPGNRIPPRLNFEKITDEYVTSNRRLFILDYDGTLVPIARKPADAIPSARLHSTLQELTKDPRNLIYVISGRDREVLEKWLGHLPGVGLSAEHGCFIRHPNTSAWENMALYIDDSWRKVVKEIFEDHRDRTPGSEIEFKTINITWHYRNADPNYADWVSKELLAHLMLGVASKMPIDVLSGKKAIEVRPKGINKGGVIRHLLHSKYRDQSAFDFILCIGDDRTDEDMFTALRDPDTRECPLHHHTIVVEEKVSDARYCVRRQSDVLNLLERLCKSKQA